MDNLLGPAAQHNLVGATHPSQLRAAVMLVSSSIAADSTVRANTKVHRLAESTQHRVDPTSNTRRRTACDPDGSLWKH